MKIARFVPGDRDAFSGQRLVDIAELPAHPRMRSAAVRDGVLCIQWHDESAPAALDLEWLRRHAVHRPADRHGRADRHGLSARPERIVKPWLEGAALAAQRDFAWARCQTLNHDDDSKLRWLTQMLQSGVAFLCGLAPAPGAILDAMAQIGRVAETNYGRVYDVRAVPAPENLAYSDRGLGLHTDNPYREPVPGFQALHVLLAAPDGGDRLFADGFAIAEHLRGIDPESFETLTRTPVPFHYRARDTELYAERPLIQLDCRGDIAAVHYKNRSIAPLTLTGRDAPAFYAAYRRFAGLLRDPRHQLKVRLRDADLVLFDNQRILHGRTGFSSARHARHLEGCYLTRDSVYSTAALLRRNLLDGHVDNRG